MKRTTLLSGALISALPFLGRADGFPLVVNGEPAAEIVVDIRAPERLVQDVDFFTNAVFRCTGAALPVVRMRTSGANAVVFDLVERGFFDLDDHEMAFPDDTTLTVRGTSLSCRWVLNRLLERNFGCVFCFPGRYGTYYPKSTDVSVPRVPYRGTASLKAERRLYADDPSWERCVGGRMQSRHGQFFGHAMTMIIDPERLKGSPLYEKVMPEKDGVRRDVGKAHGTWQPCFSAPETVDLVANYLIRYFDRNPEDRVYTISVNDMEGHCECAACAHVNGGFERRSKYYPQYVDRSVVYYSFANKVAERVAARHPDVAIGLLAYCGVTDPPPFKLHPILVPFLCTSIHQMMDAAAAARRRELYAVWNEKAEHLATWGYDYGCEWYAVPRIYTKCQKAFFDMKGDGTCPHMDGYFGEGSGLIGEGPKRYLFYRQMFDAACDPEAELERWYEAVAGAEGARDLKAYYREWEDFWTGEAVRQSSWFKGGVNAVYFLYYNHSYLYHFDPDILKRATGHLEKAVAAVRRSGDRDRLERIRRIVAYHKFYAARMTAMGLGLRPAGESDQAVRFFDALPAISQAIRDKVRWSDEILSAVGYPDGTKGIPMYRDALKALDDLAHKAVDGNFLQLMNSAVSFAGASPAVDAAIARAAASEHVLPELRDQLRTLAKIEALPNLLKDVRASQSTKIFTWDIPGLKPNRRFYCSMRITNRRVGGQPCRIYFASWHPARKIYTNPDEVFASVGPGETKHVSFFCRTGESADGGRVAVHLWLTELSKVSDLEVTDLKLCEITENK